MDGHIPTCSEQQNFTKSVFASPCSFIVMDCAFELQQLLEGQVIELCPKGGDKGGCEMALPWAVQGAWGQQRCAQGAAMGPVGHLWDTCGTPVST